MNKASIREHYLKLRMAMTEATYTLANKNLTTVFFAAIDLSAIRTIHIFLPIVSKHEPDTWAILDQLNAKFSGIKISVPKVGDDNSLINFYYEGKNQIWKNKWGIPEPEFGEITPTDKIDLVIVPLLAFDLKGQRVGYGKGYYDRFLKECRSDCKKVGLSFFDPIKEISDIDITDVKLDLVITPSQTFQFH